jgi:hypothetical protein
MLGKSYSARSRHASVPEAPAVDAIVMASAARRGGVVDTSDFVGPVAIAGTLRAVRALAVQTPRESRLSHSRIDGPMV